MRSVTTLGHEGNNNSCSSAAPSPLYPPLRPCSRHCLYQATSSCRWAESRGRHVAHHCLHPGGKGSIECNSDLYLLSHFLHLIDFHLICARLDVCIFLILVLMFSDFIYFSFTYIYLTLMCSSKRVAKAIE